MQERQAMRAYALMRYPNQLEASFMSSPYTARHSSYLEELRTVLKNVLFAEYRGIGRYPFTEYPEPEPGWQWEKNKLTDDEPVARSLFTSFIPTDDDSVPYPRAILDKVDQARAVQQALVNPEKYELVELCTLPDRPCEAFGFDVGYWGGGNFSILCDVALWPLWHPAVAEAFSELPSFLGDLNAHALFPSEQRAGEYLDWYTRQPWAEKEPSEFQVISIGALEEE